MFVVYEYSFVYPAGEQIRALLKEIPAPFPLEFQVIYSPCDDGECEEGGGTLDEANKIVPKFLDKLDAASGMMMYCEDENLWDFHCNRADNSYHGTERRSRFVGVRTGLVVMHNTKATSDGSFPIVVCKKPLWVTEDRDLLDLLRNQHDSFDYTRKISPAVYIEICYPEIDGDE